MVKQERGAEAGFRVIEHLKRTGVIAEEDLAALTERNSGGWDLHGYLLEACGMDEKELLEHYAAALATDILSEEEINLHPVSQEIGISFLREQRVLPLESMDGHIRLVTSNPCDSYPVSAVSLATGREVELCLAPEGLICRRIERLATEGASVSDLSGQLQWDGGNPDREDVDRLRDLASEAPIVRLVNLLVVRALELRASDIHIEPFEERLRVRYRVDGELRETDPLPSHSSAAIISRIKIMAQLDIAERRLPQDGRIQMRLEGRDIDLRVSTIPSLHGESVVLRILDKEQSRLDFEALGFGSENISRLHQLLSRPYGIILVTGPTGSGKTTTLYTALNVLNTPGKKIMTVEDPVEYQLDGIMQLQVKPEIGLGFAEALRAMVRQDPDIIMIGEMRDAETASIAIQSALTGHLVFSTLHTNDAGSAITRLLDLGVQDYLVASTVIGILAQRLVRTLCQECREETEPLPEIIEQHGLDCFGVEHPRLYRPTGCRNCNGTGYAGRTVIVEQLEMDDEIRRLIVSHSDASAMQSLAIGRGMTSMRCDGIRKALAGITTLEEVLRVTQEG